MMDERQVGSGFATDTATAVEGMLAAAFRGDQASLTGCERALRQQWRMGRCGIRAREIKRRVLSVVDDLEINAATARRAMPGSPGDVEVILKNGTSLWFEVKAQTKKRVYADLTQADWIRDATDTLRWLTWTSAEFRSRLPGEVEAALSPREPESYFRDWPFAQLWLADVALLPSKLRRGEIGIESPADLREFLGRKYLFHLTQEGARATVLADLPPVAAALNNQQVTYLLKDNSASLVAVPISVASQGTHFTYHVYPPTELLAVMGRHKLHARSLPSG